MSDDAQPPRVQRIAAYNVCIDETSRLLLCRLSDITERPGWWTLPGGGIHFGEDPEVAALRELGEETGLTGRIVQLLAVDSLRRPLRGVERGRLGVDETELEVDYHSVRIIYRTEITGGVLRHETDESTDRAAWCASDEVAEMLLVELGRVGIDLAFAAGSQPRTPPSGACSKVE